MSASYGRSGGQHLVGRMRGVAYLWRFGLPQRRAMQELQESQLQPVGPQPVDVVERLDKASMSSPADPQ